MSLFVAEAAIVVAATTYAIWDTDGADSDTADTNSTAATPVTSPLHDDTSPTACIAACDDSTGSFLLSTPPFDWSSSAGIFYICVLVYIFLATAANAIAMYKFWSVWNALARHGRPPPPLLRLHEEPAPVQDCPICWSATDSAGACVCHTCHRGFHGECLRQWVATGTMACPWCRGSLRPACSRKGKWCSWIG